MRTDTLLDTISALTKQRDELRAETETLHQQCEVEKRRADMADARLESAQRELKAMALLIEELRVQWANVPWSTLGCCVGAVGSMTGFFTLPLPPHGTLYSEEWKTFYLAASKWLQDNRPEEAAE